MSLDDVLAVGLGAVAGTLLLAALSENTEPLPVGTKKNQSKAKQNLQPAQPEKNEVEQVKKSKELKEAEKINKFLQDGDYPEAVSRSSKLLFDIIRRKSGVKDKDTMKLIDHVFNPNNPILRITRHDKYEHLETHNGYYFLLKGISSAFRNPAMHENVDMAKGEAVAQVTTIAHLIDIVKSYTVLEKENLSITAKIIERF